MEMQQTKISIIMPVHNMAEYLDQTIGSWANQTLTDIEIICIDDASTDASLEVLHRWAESDSRIQVYSFSENKSAWTARKLGIEKATGKYIMFADADDTILETACEELYAEAEKANVDILHFNSEIVAVNDLPENRIASMEKFLKPYVGSFTGANVFLACFRDKKYNFTLWNKIYKAAMCKNAIANTEDGFFPKAQDKLLYFILSYSAKSYKGITGANYYQYYFGRGGTGISRLNIRQFERYCNMALVADAMESFLKKNGTYDLYQGIVEKSRNDLLNDCMARWTNDISLQDKAQCFDLMLKYWRTDEVIGKLAEKKFFNRYEIACQIKDAEALKFNKRKVKTIATYYHTCANGGVQRVLCQLAHIWTDMGYKVIVLTDTAPTKDDYDLPKNVERIVIPEYSRINKDNYHLRAAALRRIIKEHEIDLVVYHAWVLNMMLWDEITIKLSGAAFVPHCHSVFSVGILNGWDNFRNTLAPYIMADAVITLGQVDLAFWQHYNNNVFDVINPVTDSLNDWDISKGDNHDILWIGRLSFEKRPNDSIRILKKVKEVVEDAKLHIVGDSDNPQHMKNLKNLIAELELEDSVILHGFHKDVKPFYQKASLFLSTSAYEGYQLTLQESKMAGLPCVTYEMPYLTLSKGNRGIIPVAQQNVTEASAAIIRLFTDREEWETYAKAARSHIEELLDYDLHAKWKEILESVSIEHTAPISESDRIMMETLMYHYEVASNRRKASVNNVSSGSKSVIQPAASASGNAKKSGIWIKKIGKKLIPKKTRPFIKKLLLRMPQKTKTAIKRMIHW